MTTRLIHLLAVLAVPSVLAVGCGGGDTKARDLAVSTTGDMAASGACTVVASFPSTSVSAHNDSDSNHLAILVAGAQADATNTDDNDQLFYEYYNEDSTTLPSLPHLATLSTSDTFTSCTDCVYAFFGYAPSEQLQGNNGTFYLAQSGSVKVTALDNSRPTGTVAAQGTDIHLVEWDMDADEAVPEGSCIDVASFSFSSLYTVADETDGGTGS